MADLTHFDDKGASRMVDTSDKPETLRQARASGQVRMAPATLDLIRQRALAKGDVLEVARLAGIMAAKRTGGADDFVHDFADEIFPARFGEKLVGSEHRTERLAIADWRLRIYQGIVTGGSGNAEAVEGDVPGEFLPAGALQVFDDAAVDAAGLEELCELRRARAWPRRNESRRPPIAPQLRRRFDRGPSRRSSRSCAGRPAPARRWP